ncbi:hypothetical protein WA026_006444 [Henosepilachna vigintioctopunctata]|uniref:Glutathione peroxidase n=1 Tax=Henosepilachna vigintioctopunctata TaxID=420089 RepID=A0AAW1TT77_9CUCU
MSTGINYKDAKSIHYFTVTDLEGEPISLRKYEGHICIIVNVASQCGMARKNFEELNELHQEYAETKGLKILAFPCNQFMDTEPGDSCSMKQYIKLKNLKFDIFEKIDVNGSRGSPLWKYLKRKKRGSFGSFIKWNFTKFIVDADGQPVERFGPCTSPKEMVKSLEKYW